VPVCVTSAGGGRTDPPDRQRSGPARVAASLARRHDHLLFDPLELLERLAALTPRPRINLVLYYGVLAAHAAWRPRLAGTDGAGTGPAQPAPSTIRDSGGEEAAPAGARGLGSNLRWAQLMQRSFGYDVLACSRCGGRMRLMALIEQGAVTARILAHLGLPTEVPAARPPRAPPRPLDAPSLWGADDDLPAAQPNTQTPRLATATRVRSGGRVSSSRRMARAEP
jgi:hypothetical protein